MEHPPFTRLGGPGNVQVVHDRERRFPGPLIQGDTLSTVLRDLEDGSPESYAAETLREWLLHYEQVLDSTGFKVPYFPRVGPGGET